jgi:hypothetical protein
MNRNRVISTALLFLLLGTTLSAFAQKEQEQKGGGKAQPAQHQAQPQRAQPAQHQAQPQRAQQAQRQAQPQRAQQPQHQAQPQRAQQAQRQAQPQRAQQPQHQAQPQRAQQARQQQPRSVASNRGNNGNHYGRISDDRYRASFGSGHSFRMMRPQMIGGYNRFQYGGYWFGYNQGWPSGWDYNDGFYVEYIDGVYYMFNMRHPGFRLTLNLF